MVGGAGEGEAGEGEAGVVGARVGDAGVGGVGARVVGAGGGGTPVGDCTNFTTARGKGGFGHQIQSGRFTCK